MKQRYLISVIVLLLLLVLSIPASLAQQDNPDCYPDEVGQWLTQLRIGENVVSDYFIDNDFSVENPLEAMLFVQKVRRDLENLPRPYCADDLFRLAIFRYDNLLDAIVFAATGNDDAVQNISLSRIEAVSASHEQQFAELEEIAAIDVDALLVEMSTPGIVKIEINYTDQWYREVFNYSPQAENIRHYVLIVPQDEAEQISPGWIFISIAFPTFPGEMSARPGQEEMELQYVYLHEAPEGRYIAELEPGTYYVAASFIAAAIDSDNDGAILYPGVTGGGASTDFREITIEPGKTSAIQINLTDDNGWG
jgi:hypothetical protein